MSSKSKAVSADLKKTLGFFATLGTVAGFALFVLRRVSR